MSIRPSTARQPAGTPIGGQFAEEPRPASGIGLSEPAESDTGTIGLGGTEVSMFTGHDGVPVVQIDTYAVAGGGRVRVNLNDGPPLFEGDPEKDEAPSVLDAGGVVALADVVTMQQQEARVRFASGDDVLSGTVRCGTWSADGRPERFDDIRASHVRITTSTGAERFLPMSQVTAMIRGREFVRDR